MKETKRPIAVFVSDLHAGLRLPHAKLAADMTTSDRLDDVISVINQVTDYVTDNEIPVAFIAGDLFDQRHPDAPTLVKTAAALQCLADAASDGLGILPGNHDAHDRAGKVYSVDLFDSLRCGKLFSLNGDEVNPFPIGEPDDNIHLIAVPWLPDKLFRERVEAHREVLPSGRNVLLFHQSVAGAKDNRYEVKSEIAPRMFEPFDLAISGHIHTPQRLGNVQYLGSPLHLRFSDAGDTERGFWVLYDDLSMEMIQTDFPPFVQWRFIADDGYSATSIVNDLAEELWAELNTNPNGNTYLDVIIEAERDDADEAAGIVARAVDESKLRSLRVSTVYTDDGASERVREAATSPGAVATTTDLIEAFVMATKAKWPDGVDGDALIAMGKEVMS